MAASCCWRALASAAPLLSSMRCTASMCSWPLCVMASAALDSAAPPDLASIRRSRACVVQQIVDVAENETMVQQQASKQS